MKPHQQFTLIVLLLLISGLPSVAQNPGSQYHNFEELIELLTEEKEDTEEDASWIGELHDLYEHPLNINLAGKEDLLKIPLLNDATAEAIIAYRNKTDSFFSLYELASVPGISRDLAEKISFFLKVNDGSSHSFPDSIKRFKGYHQLLTRSWITLPLSTGYKAEKDKPPAYTGNPFKLYTRYMMEIPDKLQIGLTGDKDPGEPFFRASNKTGFDFYSAFISYTISKRIPQVVIGDFTARAGQGLILWQGFSMGKTSEVISVSKNNSQIRPYTSSDENCFFRGVATTVKFKKNTFNFFMSSRRSDGNLLLSEDSTLIFTSLQTSGYHRTVSEVEDRKSVRHSVTGVFVNRNVPHLKFGITALYEKFEFPFIPGDQLYEKFLFKGQENFNLGSDYRWVNGKFQFFGEGAFSRSWGKALIQGMEARLHDQLNITLLFRHFDKNYHATWANAFAGNEKANNESGFFAGLKILPASGMTLSGYIDWYTSPWIRYSTASPSRGRTWMLQAKVRLLKKVRLHLRLSNKLNQVKSATGNLYLNALEERYNLRIHTDWSIDNHWTLRIRGDNVWTRSQNSEYGILIYSDIAWSSEDFPLTASFRLSWYNTPSYDTRIYAYENDLLYAFSFPSLFGKGVRSFLNLHWKVSQSADAWFKAGITLQSGEEKMGSGYGELNSNSKKELKIQIRYRF
jgi:hypothetical protein